MARETLAGLRAIIAQKDQEIQALRSQVADLETKVAATAPIARLSVPQTPKRAFVRNVRQIQCPKHGLVTPGNHGCPKCYCEFRMAQSGVQLDQPAATA